MGKLILGMEEEPKKLKLIRDVLRVNGYATLEATNGKQGVEMAKSKMPDLILMDIQMPIMDGFEATRILKTDAETSKIPIVALTSYAMVGDEERIHEAGCDGYLTKPIDINKFLKIVAEYLSEKCED
jgi:two-component system cell cycle response regulator DivK